VSCLQIFINLSSSNYLLQDPNFSLVNSPTKFEKVVAGLSEDQQQAVRDMGLGGPA
jgi:hypothetical protein